MTLKSRIKKNLREGNYIVKKDDLNDVGPEIEKKDKEAIIKVVDESETSEIDESNDIYAVCTDSTGETKGNTKWEKCVKDLKNKKGQKLGESIKPKMTKQELIETVNKSEYIVINKIKVKDILSK